jgi:hypothetical protein
LAWGSAEAGTGVEAEGVMSDANSKKTGEEGAVVERVGVKVEVDSEASLAMCSAASLS